MFLWQQCSNIHIILHEIIPNVDHLFYFSNIWRRTKLEIHRQLYTDACNAVTASITKAKILNTFDLNIDSFLDAIRCIAEIKTWMTANYLKVNDDKSECMPVVPRSAAHLHIGEVQVTAVKNVRNLGAYLDCHLDMSHNVAILLKSCYFHM